MDVIFTALVIVACVAVIIWNAVPAVRERMRGYTTIVEGAIGTLGFVLAQAVGVVHDAQASGVLPPNWQQYVPFLLLAWIIYKRVTTRTPPGQS